jgi:hypothetical protein
MHFVQTFLQKGISDKKGNLIYCVIDFFKIDFNTPVISKEAPQILAKVLDSMDRRPLPIHEPYSNARPVIPHR